MKLFDQESIHLNLGSSDNPVPRHFDEISIVHTGNWTGFGSLSSTLKLAEGMRREFPTMPVVVYFTNEQDYMQLPQLVKGHDIHKRRSSFSDGIELALVTDAELKDHTNKNCLSLINPIKPDCPRWNETRGPPPSVSEFFTGTSKLNIYVQEYDCDRYVNLPQDFNRNIPYIDNAGNVHIVVRTGFGDSALGIHLDPNLGKLTADKSQRLKLLQEAGVVGNLEDLSQRLWGLCYVGTAPYEVNRDYERKIVWPMPNYRERVVVFSMATFSNPLSRGYLVQVKHPPKG